MGDSVSKYDEPLQPQAAPLWGVDARFCQPREVTLLLREKVFSWSGDDFKVKEPQTGMEWFQIKGKNFSLREKKTLFDVHGAPVWNIKESLLSFFEPNYKVYAGGDSERELFKIVAHVTMAKSKMHTTITNGQTGQQMLITLKGNILTHEAVVFLGEAKQGGIPLAKIHRPLTGREWLTGKQDYFLTVAPNVDIAMMLTFCIALDEMKKDN